MIGDNDEDVVVDKYDKESYSEISEDCFSTDDSWNISDIEVDNSVIVIDSEVDAAIVPTAFMARTQTFVFTIRRET